MNDSRWIGPFRIEQLLGDIVARKLPQPPERGSAYVITQEKWETRPSKALYVGGNSGQSSRFRTRVGDMIADTFGFFGGGTGHHSGGRSLHVWCQENQFNPLKLYVGWVESCLCHRCLEVELYERLSPKLNQVRPSRCPEHSDCKRQRK